jgi:isoquinoline 1-oxidoreductase beta subunit
MKQLDVAQPLTLKRRSFLKLSGAGLVLGVHIACSSDDRRAQRGVPPGNDGSAGTGGDGVSPGGAGQAGQSGDMARPDDLQQPDEAGLAEPDEACPPEQAGPTVAQSDVNAYVRIGVDDTITMSISETDMGQGVLTSLPMILAEELDVDWAKVRSEHPIANQQLYGQQATFASSSISGGFAPMRQAGAAARQMLLAAAAQRWNVPVAQLRTELGVVYHDQSGQSARYGELAELAATLDAPANPPLKDPSSFRLIGTPRAQLNARAKASGTAQYSLDVRVPDMLVGLVARSPVIGGTVATYDDTAARQVEGVRDVVQIPAGIAVLADHYWAALKGRDALTVTWNEGQNATLNTTELFANAGTLGTEVAAGTAAGDADGVINGAAGDRKLDVTYELPYLAHAPMEPLNALADVRNGAVEIWAGTQVPSQVVTQAAQIAGVNAANVTLHVPLLGGGFGRRATTDYVMDAVQASLAAGRPVKLMFAREDDMRGAYYRPFTSQRLRGSVDANGLPSAWLHNVITPAIFGGGVDAFAVEGITNLAYAIPNRRYTYRNPQIQVPVFTWRSVGSSQNAFVIESFIDELAALGGRDPLELRLSLLSNPRHANALSRAAERAGWGGALPEGHAQGLAVHETFGTVVAEVAEVSIEDGQVRVHRVVAAVDCGQAINPSTIEAQVEGSIMFGLSAALYGEISFENGRPVQGNFDSYRMLRMNQAPAVEVEIIANGDPITGLGEPGVPPIAPAVCNALFRLTGNRIRRLPIQLS